MLIDRNQLNSIIEKIQEKDLRSLGFGYRAKYIIQAIDHLIKKGGRKYLNDLKLNSDKLFIRNELLLIPGIGPKVSDCILLMAFKSPSTVPIDTHMLKIAIRDYKFPKPKTKSLTEKTYFNVAKLYKDKFGLYAGWTHSVLFAKELKQFKGDSNIKEE